MKVSDQLYLRAVTPENIDEVLSLMREIYPPVYAHLWEDGGTKYLGRTYSNSSLLRELETQKAIFSFVEYKSQTAGLVRVIHNEPLIDHPEKVATKLHRIYLSPTVHGNGIGSTLMDWVEETAREAGSELLWLEAMATQANAVRFYKKSGFEICGYFDLEAELVRQEFKPMCRMFKFL